MNRLFKILILLCLWIPFGVNAQHYVFKKSFGDTLNDRQTYSYLKQDGSSIVAWVFDRKSKIDTQVLAPIKTTNNSGVIALAKLDTAGKSIWTWTYDSTNFCYMNLLGVKISSNTGDIYAYGSFAGSFWVDGKQYKAYDTVLQTSPPPRQRFTHKYAESGFILQLSKDGTFKKIFNFKDSNETEIDNLEINTNNELIISVDYKRMGTWKRGTFTSYNKGVLFIPEVNTTIKKPSLFVLKLDAKLKIKTISDVFNGYFQYRKKLKLNNGNEPYLMVELFNNDSLVTKNKTWYSTPNPGRVVYLFQFTNGLKFIKSSQLFFSKNDNGLITSTFNIDKDNNLYLAGVMGDSVRLNGKLIYEETPCFQRPYIFKVDSNLNILWKKIAECNNDGSTARLSDLVIDSLGVYFGGYIAQTITIDDYYLPKNLGNFWFFKLDPRGNILWMQRNGKSNWAQSINSLSKNKKGEILISGIFNNSLQIDDTTFITNNETDGIILKIHDIEIYRGEVSEGPYCAGDTLLVPYNIVGRFDTSNYFIAQLSDEDGNFTGAERELGRIKSNRSDTVIGLLPDIGVYTSNNYRIRILSTSPKVQSYYKFDTLRLLIYSTDSADAGADTTVCYGNPVELKTTGGSEWKWTPATSVLDSAYYKTYSNIDSSTQFRVIISDSSGCGVTDTAYKYVKVIPALKIHNTDTSVCLGTSTKFTFKVSGGDSANYHYQWLDTFGYPLSDSISYVFKADSSQTLVLILADSCSAFNDTLYINITVLDSLKIKTIADTLFCQNDTLNINTNASGGLGKYQFQWSMGSQVLSDSSLLKYKVDSAVQIKLKVTDLCTLPLDSVFFKVSIYDSLKTQFNLKDSLVCNGQKIKLSIAPKGGKGKIEAQWFIRDTLFSQSNTFIQKRFFKASKVKVSITDVCKNMQADSIDISVLPKLNITNIIDTTLCYKTNFRINPIITGGIKPSFDWYYPSPSVLYKNYTQLDTNLSLIKSLSSIFVASDGCSYPNDTVVQKITVLDSLQISLLGNACAKDSFFVNATVKGGKAKDYQYNWLLDNQPLLDSTSSIGYKADSVQWVILKVNDGCSPLVKDSIKIVPKVQSTFVLDRDTVCFGQQIQIKNTSKVFGLESLKIENNLDNIQNTNYDSIQLELNTGAHLLQQIIKDTSGCIDTFSQNVMVHPLPSDLIFQITARPKIQDDYFEVFTLHNPIIKHRWFVSDTFFAENKSKDTLRIKARDTGDISIKMISISEHGCIDSFYKTIYVVGNNTVFIPNTFSPNNDGHNDLFYPQGKSIQHYQMQVYNRWGERVFNGNMDEPWNGKRCLQGIYIYMIVIYINDRFDAEKYHDHYERFDGSVLLKQ